MKRTVRSTDAPAPIGPYSQGATATGPLLFVAGQTPKDPRSGEIPQDFRAQVQRCMENLKAIVEAAGATLNDVVKVNAYLADIGQFAVFNEVYARFFSEPFPARTTIGANLPGISIEVDAVAALPS